MYQGLAPREKDLSCLSERPDDRSSRKKSDLKENDFILFQRYTSFNTMDTLQIEQDLSHLQINGKSVDSKNETSEVEAILYPVRCMTCNKVLGHLGVKVPSLLKKGCTFEEIFKICNIERVCCRSILMTTVDVNTIAVKYAPLPKTDS